MSDESSLVPGREPVIYSRDEHAISRDNIDPDALKIMYRLIRYGYKAFLVGGGVRDLLLGKRPKDFDISTDATPRRIKEIFRNSRIIGRRFKLVHIYFRGNKIIEVSTFRDVSDAEPVESDDERELPSMPLRDNTYGTEETDAIRRDITINGLFYDVSNFSIIDYVGGMEDLRRGIIRVIGDPDVRFPEDPVRMIRVVRHAVRSGCEIEENTWFSVLKNKRLICDVAPMRVYEELKKDLLSGSCLEILRRLGQSGLLEFILPDLVAEDGAILMPRSDLANALADTDAMVKQGDAPSPTVVLALIVYFIRAQRLSRDQTSGQSDLEDVHDLMLDLFRDLAVPKKERERIDHLLNDFDRLAETQPQKVKANLYAKKPHLDDLITFCRVVHPDYEQLASALERARNSDVHEESRDRRRQRADRHNDHGRRIKRMI